VAPIAAGQDGAGGEKLTSPLPKSRLVAPPPNRLEVKRGVTASGGSFFFFVSSFLHSTYRSWQRPVVVRGVGDN